jgi:hypothetical protein
MKHFLFLAALCFFFSCEEEEETAYDLRQNAIFYYIKTPLTYFEVLDSQSNLNYVRTLLCTWKLTFENPYAKKFQCTGCDPRAWDEYGRYSQAFSSVSDYKNAIQYSGKMDQAGPDREGKGNIKTYDAASYLSEKLKDTDIIMFNEAHDRAQCRGFVLSMLPYFKKAGATHLALEMLYENEHINDLNVHTGAFTREPVAGQLVREALKLGFKLISYEDTVKGTTATERDRNQARNLLNKIKNNSGIHKTIVLGGYGHTSELMEDTSAFKPMAMYFKELSGIDPLTVNLVSLLQFSPMGDFYRDIIEAKADPKPDTLRLITTEDLYSFCSNAYGLLHEADHYDLFIYYPNVTYVHDRPTWLITSKEKEFVPVPLPFEINPVLVQAYVASEIEMTKDYNKRIPYDQTFMCEKGKLWFALKKGERYIIVYRDENNNIIFREDLTI